MQNLRFKNETVVCVVDGPYGFQNTNVATTLAYANTKKAVRDSVEADNKMNSKNRGVKRTAGSHYHECNENQACPIMN